MATNNKLDKYLSAYGPDSVMVLGSFTTAGAGAPTLGEGQGIVSVSRTGTGVYLLTLARGWKAITVTLGLQHTTQAATPVVTALSATARTVTVSMLAASTGTDTTGAVVHIQAVLRKAV